MPRIFGPAGGGGSGITDGEARLQAVESRTRTGVNLPSDFGSRWLPKLAAAKAGTGKAVLAIQGDSVGRGFNCSLPSKGPFAQVGASLRGANGSASDGGSGFKSAFMTDVGLAERSVGTPFRTAWAGEMGSTTGTWAGFLISGTQSTGPGLYALKSSTVGSTYTEVVRGTTVTIYTASDAAASGGAPSPGFSYTIDGGAAVVVNGVTTPNTVTKTVITGLSAGDHTVVVTYRTGQTTPLYVAGVSGENTNGVVFNSFTIPGMNSGGPRNADPAGSGSWSGGSNYPADLLIYEQFLNDVSAPNTADVWIQYMRRFLADAKNGGTLTGDTEILIVLPHVGKFEFSNVNVQDFFARVFGFAEGIGAGVVNFTALGRWSWNYWNSLNYWGNIATPGATGTDNGHPSDAGANYMRDILLPVIATGKGA